MNIKINSFVGFEKNENPSQFIINLLWYSPIIVDIVRKIGEDELITVLTRNVLYVFVFLYVLIHAFMNKRASQIIIPGFSFALLFCISLIIYPSLLVSAEGDVLLFYSRCLTGLYLALNVKSWKKVLIGLASWHWIGFFYSLHVFINGLGSINNYMPFSYGLLLPALITVAVGLTEKKIIQIVSGAVMIMAMFIFGARGSLVCALVALFFMVFNGLKRTVSYKRVIVLITLFTMFVFISIFADNILLYLLNEYPQARNLNFLISSQTYNMSGREFIYLPVIEEILNDPVLPRGFMADRIYLGRFFTKDNVYPHNLALEIVFQFGIFGWLFLAWIVFDTIKMYCFFLKNNDAVRKTVFVLFVITVLTKLMFSSSYVSDMQFWFAMGCLSCMLKQVND